MKEKPKHQQKPVQTVEGYDERLNNNGIPASFKGLTINLH